MAYQTFSGSQPDYGLGLTCLLMTSNWVVWGAKAHKIPGRCGWWMNRPPIVRRCWDCLWVRWRLQIPGSIVPLSSTNNAFAESGPKAPLCCVLALTSRNGTRLKVIDARRPSRFVPLVPANNSSTLFLLFTSSLLDEDVQLGHSVEFSDCG